MMYEKQSGPKTQLGTYIRNQHNFCFGLLGNESQCQPLSNKHPGLVAMPKCGWTILDKRSWEQGKHLD